MNSMKDAFNREIDYVRLSLTDRCDLRCTYCMPATGLCFLKKEQLLTDDEIIFLLRILAKEGIKKVKLTGGEPLVRPNLLSLIKRIKQISGIEKVTLTTNGMKLAREAQGLKEAGLEQAIDVGLANIKINTVARKEISEATIVELAEIAKKETVHLRFIEMMPIGLGKEHPGKQQEEVEAILTKHYGTLQPYKKPLGNGPASYYALKDFKGKIGFISALGHCFCETCNRIRITADGHLKTCLHSADGYSLKEALAMEQTAELLGIIKSGIACKPEKHLFLEQQGEQRFMSQIGG
ncbi:radical SAM protein [Enterococcus faecalis]|nr:radical SAM protein [Enterococcus faecalis]EKZ0489627.1 radical SAM protein [Enterococcus faecalis]